MLTSSEPGRPWFLHQQDVVFLFEIPDEAGAPRPVEAVARGFVGDPGAFGFRLRVIK